MAIPPGAEYDYVVTCTLATPGEFSYDFEIYTSCPGKAIMPLTVQGTIVEDPSKKPDVY